MRSTLLVLLHILLTATALAQSGIQWGGNAHDAVARARERGVPVMFWVTERAEFDEDELDDLIDAQHDAFRDPAVLELTTTYFVPCRVARNSNVLAEAQRLGLPSDPGLSIALIAPDGQVLDQIEPGAVAQPDTLASRLADASRAYRAAMYQRELRPILTDPQAPKSKVRRAVRTAWQLRMYDADRDLVALLQRADLTEQERARLYQLLGAFATEPCINALLAAAPTDQHAADALADAGPAALASLFSSMPPAIGEPSPVNLAAYNAATAIARVRGAKPQLFWAGASPEERAAEIERVSTVAQAVYDTWYESEGRWR